MEHSKIYIVTSGEYSDYSIEKVFIDEKIANDYAASVFANVEEWEISDNSEIKPEYKEGLNIYYVAYSRGEINDVCKQSYYAHYYEKALKKEVIRGIYLSSGDFYWGFYLFAKNEIHAAKIVSEKIAYLKAMNLYNVSPEEWKKLKDGTF